MRFRYCILLWPALAAAQPAADTAAVGWVRLDRPPAGATLAAGDSTLGDAAGIHDLPPGTHLLTLTAGAAHLWDPPSTTATIRVVPAETLVVDMRLPIRYHVATVPSGAQVALERPGGAREPLGAAPLTVDRPEPMQGLLVATRPGFGDARSAPGDSAVNRVTLVLPPLTASEGAEVDWRPPGRPRAWIDVAAGALALAAGAVAIHYKFRADEVDDRYRNPGSPERGDPDLRVEAQRLDRISAGALGVMQVGLGVLAIRLVLR